jgi:hypothetical protein
VIRELKFGKMGRRAISFMKEKQLLYTILHIK